MTAPDLERYIEVWQAAGIGPHVIGAGNGHLVVTTRGARVVPFDELGRPLLWLASQVLPGADVAAWAAGDDWNFGAERLWIGPELRLMVKDRHDFDGSYQMSRDMDPGDWQLTAEPTGLRQKMSLPVHQPPDSLRLAVEQHLAIASNPARRWQESEGLRHLGWLREVALSRSEDDERSVACQAWVLAQVEAPATVLVPGAGAAQVTDYFEPIDGAHLHRRGDDLALAITGRQRYKVGVRTGEHRGIIACWRGLPHGEAALLVRYFYDAPSSRYLEEPPRQPGHEGDSLFGYNDGGLFGNFGEVEALGRTLEPAADEVRDVFEFHAWWGERSALRVLAGKMLGMVLPGDLDSGKE